MKKLMVVLFIGLALPSLVFGQAQTAQPPKPEPAVQRLGYFVGTWKIDSAPATDPKRKSTATIVCEWFPGGFSVVCRSEGTGPQGPRNALYIFSYDPVDKTYTLYGIDGTSAAPRVADTLTVQGNTWTSESETPVDGKPAKVKHVIVELSPSTYSYKVELSVDGGPWRTVSDRNGTRVK